MIDVRIRLYSYRNMLNHLDSARPMNLRRHLPSKDQLRETRYLGFLGNVIFEPNLWHFNRYSLSYAVLFGSICCFLPIPFQMIPCILICVWVRCNVPVAVAIVWISNPITFGPMMYFAYRVGTTALGIDQQMDPFNGSREFTDQLVMILQPLLVGCFISGFGMGITGFMSVRLYYRWRASRYKQRKQKDRNKTTRT